MTLDKATVARIATLARLRVAEGEQERLAGELSNILDWIEQLDEIDTDNVEPLRSVMELERSWRADKVDDGGDPAAVTANAPKAHAHYFVVPKVVE